MLVRVAINGELHQIGPYTAVVQQSVALAWRAIAGDPLSITLAPNKEFHEVVTNGCDLPRKPSVTIERVQARAGFFGEHLFHEGCTSTGPFDGTDQSLMEPP